jgi:phosphomannomutase
MMVKLKAKPSELLEALFKKVGYHYYDRIDSPFSGDRESREKMILDNYPQTLGGLKVVGLDKTDGYKFTLEDGGFMLIRFSGTEPILRVYTETTYQDKVQLILDDGLKVAGVR